MARIKIDYGIDLGTTNSAICRMEKGEPKIIKSDTLKDTMPSCVSFTKKQTLKVGDTAYADMKSDMRRASKKWKKEDTNTYIEFKRTIGTDKGYFSRFMNKEYNSEELSAEVLKALKSFVQDEDVKSIIITVPAKFNSVQKDATVRAAKLAGFDYCELLQEPIAASIAYGLSSEQKDGYWMVFDLGGGTFDAALLRLEDGIMQVFDTEGDNFLGGKDLDYAIVDQIIIPYIQQEYNIGEIINNDDKRKVLRDALKTYAEEAKIQLSFKQMENIISNIDELGEDEDGNEIELDITINQEQLKNVFSPVFQKAINICKDLLKRNNLTGEQLNSLILVGGPTHSPILRQMLKEQITGNVRTDIDPMTAVAYGAALYASTKESHILVELEKGTIALDVNFESTTVETIEYVSVKLNKAKCTGTIPQQLFVEFTRSDKDWASGKIELNEIGDVIECQLREGRANNFIITVYDNMGTKYQCFPEEISILQGSKIGNAVLPYNFGIEVWDSKKKYGVIQLIKGLEKNQHIPATGVINGLKTINDLRCGIETDIIRIPIYEAERESQGCRAAYEQISYEVVISGEDVPAFVPAGSEVNITLKYISDSERKLIAYIPNVDCEIEKELNANQISSDNENYINTEISKAQHSLRELGRDGEDINDLSEELKHIKDANSEGGNEGVLTHLREILRKIDKKEADGAWTRMEKKLRRAFSMLEEDNKKYKTNEDAAIDKIRSQVDDCIRHQDVEIGEGLLDAMHQLNFKIARLEYYIVWINDWNVHFCETRWKDTTQAKHLINQGIAMINNSASANELQPIVNQLIHLMPEEDIPDDINILGQSHG